MNKNNSMINPSIVDLLKKVDNRYSLVVATSRRARQLIEGVDPHIADKDGKPLTIAINEVNEGSISVTERSEIEAGEEGAFEGAEAIAEELEEVEVPGNAEGVEEGLV